VNTDTFYATASALCFTLLGFWWVVVQFRHADFTGDATRRHFAFLVSLYFILPGLVSLASLIAGGGALWRVAFVLAGLAGLGAVIVAVRVTAPTGALLAVVRGSLLAAPLFALQVLFAAAPDLARNGLHLEPLQVEGYLLVLVLLLGLAFAWVLFTEPITPAE
jgi:hypothetical protein